MNKYKHTINACFVSYVIQAIVNNFAPLLFLTFRDNYGIPLEKITLMIAVNFTLQLTIDLLSALFIDKIGYRAAAVGAHIMSALGLVSLAILPDLLPDAFCGLIISVVFCAVGGGLLEVLVSPLVDACMTENKAAGMSLLHSFYCWGSLAVIVVTTVFLAVFGKDCWRILAVLWALVPIINAVIFMKVPIAPIVGSDGRGMKISELFKNKSFLILLVMMVAAGAAEVSISQWSSTFAESGLGVSKTVGDLAGPAFFALMMGISRVFYGKFGSKINLKGFMLGSGILCVIAYLMISLSPSPVLSFIGCGVCGMSVGILWPGGYSVATEVLPRGGSAMFALLALGGDLGCGSGPAVVGLVSGMFSDNLSKGILAAVAFPVVFCIAVTAFILISRKKKS